MKRHRGGIQVCACIAMLTSCANVGTAGMQDSDAGRPTKEAAEKVAYTELAAHLGIDRAQIRTMRSEAHTWPNSGLGCAKPGTMTAQVLSPGFAFILNSPQGTYRVNATEDYAVVCGTENGAPSFRQRGDQQSDRQAAVSIRNLNAMVEAARRDLAAKLKVPIESVQTVQFTAAQWPDSSMECAVGGESVTRRPVRGYRIELQHAGRSFIYHTDLERVRPCPPLETQ